VLQTACPDEWAEILEILRGFRLCALKSEAAGGRKVTHLKQIDSAFYAKA